MNVDMLYVHTQDVTCPLKDMYKSPSNIKILGWKLNITIVCMT
jgi:hypothetical protein